MRQEQERQSAGGLDTEADDGDAQGVQPAAEAGESGGGGGGGHGRQAAAVGWGQGGVSDVCHLHAVSIEGGCVCLPKHARVANVLCFGKGALV